MQVDDSAQDNLLLPGKSHVVTMSEMYRSSSSMEAFSSLDFGEFPQHQPMKSEENSSSFTESSRESNVFCNEVPLADIFSDLVQDIKEADSEKQTTSGDQEILPESGAVSPTLWSYGSPQVHNVSPVSTLSEDGSTGRSKTLAGMLKELIQSKLSFKFSTPDTCISQKSQEHEADSNFSPTTVLHRHTESSSPTLNSILPFPASFPVVKSPMEALLLANSFSFSLSQAVPESPEAHAVSPLSFDAGSPCEHHLPGRFGFYSERNGELKAKSGPQWLHTSNGSISGSLWRKSITFNSNGEVSLPRKTGQLVSSTYRSKSMKIISHTNPESLNSEVKLRENENVAASRSSSKGSNTTTTTTASSEFSIDLGGKPASAAAVEMNSSRYLELDFNKEEVYSNNDDVKSEIRSRVEEVVRKRDESKFTYSPVASSFFFAKSASPGTSTGITFSGSLEGYIDLQPEQASTTPDKKPRLIQRMSRSSSRNSQHHENSKTACCSWSCC